MCLTLFGNLIPDQDKIYDLKKNNKLVIFYNSWRWLTELSGVLKWNFRCPLPHWILSSLSHPSLLYLSKQNTQMTVESDHTLMTTT